MSKDEKGSLVPDPENGTKSIAILAKLLDMSTWGVHLYIKKNRVPPKKAKQIVELSGGSVSLDDFSTYIFD